MTRFFWPIYRKISLGLVSLILCACASPALAQGTVTRVGPISLGNIDSLNATNRIADNTHLNDTGAAAAATLVYNAMHASGAPF
jgi:hypothetical protein